MELRNLSTVEAFALIVDINGFACMVSRANDDPPLAQYVRDVLAGGIRSVESSAGDVVAFMGDSFLALVPEAEGVVRACRNTAKDLDKQCECISNIQTSDPDAWSFSPGGPSIKIGIEFGVIGIIATYTRLLGEQKLCIGECINYASRIMTPGEGNRCHVGQSAREKIASLGYELAGPAFTGGKTGERPYPFWKFDMSHIWREGRLGRGKDTYRGE